MAISVKNKIHSNLEWGYADPKLKLNGIKLDISNWKTWLFHGTLKRQDCI